MFEYNLPLLRFGNKFLQMITWYDSNNMFGQIHSSICDTIMHKSFHDYGELYIQTVGLTSQIVNNFAGRVTVNIQCEPAYVSNIVTSRVNMQHVLVLILKNRCRYIYLTDDIKRCK